MKRLSTRSWSLISLAGMGTVYFILACSSLCQKSVTIDETGHLPVGYNVLTTGDFRYCELNPPLVNVLSAVPLLFMDVVRPGGEGSRVPDPGFSFWRNATAFRAENQGSYQRIYTVSRTVTVLLVGLLGVLLFFWAGRLVPEYPNRAGLLAALFLWFSPGVLAQARWVTTDAGVAFFMALSLYVYSLYLEKRTATWVFLSGLTLGLAQLSKFTAVYLYLALAILQIAWFIHQKEKQPGRFLLEFLGIVLVSLLTIDLGYLFQGVGHPLGGILFESTPFRSLKQFFPGWIPLPLPESYLLALDRQTADTLRGDPSFLFGHSFVGGKWYYFFALSAIKTPLPGLLLVGLAVILRTFRKGWREFENPLLLLPAGLVLFAFSFLSNKQIGIRMILPAAPLLWLWTAVSLSKARWTRRTVSVVALLCCWYAAESFWIYPDYSAYFNQLIGGPSQGYRYALDSNLDWGQDLPKLKRYMDEEGIDTIQLLYFGAVDPSLYGIRYEVPKQAVKPGLLAISVSLYGIPAKINDHGRYFRAGPFDLNPDLFGKPIANLGNTIHVYRVRAPEKAKPDQVSGKSSETR